MPAQPAANMQKHMATNLQRLQKFVWPTLRRVACATSSAMHCLAAADVRGTRREREFGDLRSCGCAMHYRSRNCASTQFTFLIPILSSTNYLFLKAQRRWNVKQCKAGKEAHQATRRRAATYDFIVAFAPRRLVIHRRHQWPPSHWLGHYWAIRACSYPELMTCPRT